MGDPFPDYEKDKDGKPVLGKDGKIQPLAFVMSYAGSDATSPGGTALTDGKPDYAKDPTTFNYHTTAASVVAPHNWNFAFIQACIAILILVGFESVTSMGEEAKNAKRDIPRAVLLSLFIQGVVCYLIEYFAANYFLNAGYKLTTGGRFRRPDRRHDGDHRHVALRQLRRRPLVHVDPGHHGLPGPDRHDALLHQHRRPRDLRHGPRRRSALALRHVARQEADPAPGHLDAGLRLDGDRHPGA